MLKKIFLLFRKAEGFTLLEILLVGAIILIIVGILVPRLDTGLTIQQLNNDAKSLASNLNLARHYALSQRAGYRSYGLIFYSDYYRVVPYDASGTPLTPVIVPASTNSSGDIPLANNISLTSGPTTIIFDYRGTITADTQYVLSNNNNATKTITINQLGKISVS